MTCSSEGYVNEIRKPFNASRVSEVCTIICAKKKKVIDLKGELNYVIPASLRGIISDTKSYADTPIDTKITWPDWIIHMKYLIDSCVDIIGFTVIILVLSWITLKYIIPYITNLVR